MSPIWPVARIERPDAPVLLAVMPKRSTLFLIVSALAAFALSQASVSAAARLDRSFGHRGYVEVPGSAEWIGEAPTAGHRAAAYPGGRLVVGGHSVRGFAVYRYLPDGRPDRRFGDDGIAVVKLPGESGKGSFGSVSALAVQPDGRILAAGLYTPFPVENCNECEPEYGDSREYSAVVRLHRDGALDTSFGGSRHGHRHQGMVLLHDKSINDMVVRRGKILIAGEAVQGPEEFGEDGYVARLDSAGSLDRSFGRRRGIVHLPPSRWDSESAQSSVGGIRLDAAGRIYAGGFDRGRFMLARLTRRGDIDRGFGRRGFVRTRVAGRCRCAWGQGLARDRRGRLLISGYVRLGDRSAIAIARYLPGGKLDPSFGRSGIVRTRLERAAYGDGVAVQRNGRIVVAASIAHPHVYLGLFAAIRYMPDGSRDRSFFGDGVFEARFLKPGDRAVQPLLDTSGRLLIVGETIVARFRGGS